MNNLSVSIITPMYNNEVFIEKTVDSILSQSYSAWELIIIDDCSSDKSVELIRIKSLKDARIRLIELNKNSGAAVARNKGIEAAQGRYIAFLDSDDQWLPTKLETQLKFMQENNLDFTYMAYNKIDENGKVISEMGVPSKLQYSDLLKKCEIGCLTAMYDTHNLGKVYMPLIRKRQDLGLWLRILKKTKYAYGLNKSLALYTVREDSISANKKKAALYTWKLYRDIEELPLHKAIYYFSHYAVNGLLRTKFPKIAKTLGIIK